MQFTLPMIGQKVETLAAVGATLEAPLADLVVDDHLAGNVPLRFTAGET